MSESDKGAGQRLYERAKSRIPGGTQLLSKRPEMFLPEQWPAYYSRAEGTSVWDLDGNRYTDMSICGVGSCPLGFADPHVNRAVVDAVSRGSMTTLNCPEEVELAELLCELHPWAEMARFARTGGEAMAMAVRIARASTGRSLVAFCGYHGWSDWYLAANLAGDDALGGEGVLLPGLEPAGVPRELAGTAEVFHFNAADELRAIADRNAGRLAAIVCEPQRFERPEPGFLDALREVADRQGAVLVFDEITSAMRLNTGGVHLLYEARPDIAVFAKGLGNGFPIAAVIGTREAMEAAQSTFISSTYWTERIGPTAALATIARHQESGAADKMIHAGRRVQSLWRSTAEAAGLAIDVGHPDMPPLSHFSFQEEQAREIRTLYCQLMLRRGILDNAAFYATSAHTDEILDDYEIALQEAFDELARIIRRGEVIESLDGPVGHSGFARLTGKRR